jgi:hypothetical protein
VNGYCVDCPDREACHQGMSCDLSRRFAAAASLFQQKMKGNTNTMSNTAKKTTPADVVAQAAEEKLVVPAQGESKETVEEPKLKVIDQDGEQVKGDTEDEKTKKSLKERAEALSAKLKEHKKAIIVLGVSAGVATVAVVKYVKKQAGENLVEELDQVVPEAEVTDEPAA